MIPTKTLFKKQIEKPPDTIKYVFIVNDEFFAENLIMDKCMSVLVTENGGEEAFTIEEFNSFMYEQAYTAAKDYFYLPLLSKWDNNKVINNLILSHFEKISKNAWTILSRKGGNSDYYKAHPEQLRTKAANFINGLEKEEGTYQDLLSNGTTENNIFVPDMKLIPPSSNLQRYQWNDIGISNLFADTFKPICRYVPEAKSWYGYDGRVWKRDVDNLYVSECAKRMAYQLVDYARANEFGSQEATDNIVKMAFSRTQKKYRDTVIKDAASVHPISLTEFDKQRLYVNVQNGTINLETMTLQPHSPDDCLSKIMNVTFDPDAKCERWTKFIDEITCGNKELAKYLQKIVGYCLTANTNLECLFIFYGKRTRNGKGTFINTLLLIFNDYARTAQPDTIAEKFTPNNGNASEDVARLNGIRFVNVPEPKRTLKLDEAKVKQFTGGDPVTARFLHQNSIEFIPVWKFIINTNHLPVITDNTMFESGRVRVIPFDRHFTENERDMTLKTFFQAENNKSAILNWVLEGYKLFKVEGLSNPPDIVVNATNEYKEESDVIGQFIGDRLIESPGEKTKTSKIHEVYSEWCTKNGCKFLSSKNFIPELRTRGFDIKKNGHIGNFIENFALCEENPFAKS